jgi:hypothetical protein
MIKTRYLIIVVLLFCGNALHAQFVPAWGGGADEKDFSAGFTFSYVSSYFKIDKKPNWRAPYFDNTHSQVTDSARSISSADAPGFAVGFLGRYRLTEHLEVRANPGLIFADRSLSYTYNTSTQDRVKPVHATLIDFPVSMKLKSDRIGNLRAYVLGGVKYSQSLGSKSDENATSAPLEKMVRNVNGYGSYEVGFGFDIYFEFFKMSPEVKLSNSFGNVLLRDNTAFSSPIDKLTLHTLMFSLHFE